MYLFCFKAIHVGFSKHKCSGKTSKPTDLESLIWSLEIDTYKKFHRAFDGSLVLTATGLKYG